MNIAKRISNLGTETAFAVSAEAKAFAAEGNRVYPFHLGDMNIKTPQNIIDAANKAMNDGMTGYCSNQGIPELRDVLSADINNSHGTSYTADNIAIQPGGKPVIGKFILSVMNPGDEVLYPNPGYPIYESMIEFHGGKAVPYGFVEGKDNFELDFEALESKVSPKTTILVYNNLQNPTGAESSDEEMKRIADFVLKHDLMVLNDEAYFDIRYQGSSKSLASLPGMAERCLNLYTFSKKFAMTGWRLGAAIGPKEIIDIIAKLNVNDESCSNHFIQWAAVEGITGDQSESRRIIGVLKDRRDAAVDILNSIPGVSCYRPEATFYLFPNVTGLMAEKGLTDYDSFRKAVLHDTGVSVCSRLHFGRELPGEENRYIRLAYSGIDTADIREGLGLLKDWAGA